MKDFVFRSVKAIVFFGMMYLSLKYLGVANDMAIIVSLILLTLSVLNMLAGLSYSIVVLVFILAILSALLPAKYDNGVDFVSKMSKDSMFAFIANR
jgi:hypothetical protein